MTLGQKLKKLRTDNNLTQKELADRLHVTFQTVSKWENDTNEPDFSTLKELSKIYNVSVEFLFNEDEEYKEEEVEEVVPSVPMSSHVCKRCHKDIPEGDIAIDKVAVRSGRSTMYIEEYYHRECLKEVYKERNAEAKRKKHISTSKAKKKCFGWGIGGGVAALATFLIIFLAAGKLGVGLSILWSVIIGYSVFAGIYCILSGSYIGDVFISVASWSIKFPGVIFSFDIEGFIFLIAMKVLFAILGFFVGLFTLVFAAFLSAFLGAVSFPFVLISNIKNQYDNAL